MPSSIRGDGPIRTAKEDLLRRAKLVHTIADQIRRIDPSEGFVVGIIGPWGSGKTSLVNLVLEDLRATSGYTVVEFNPWMFSGADQLVERFFDELADQLGESPQKKLKSVAKGLTKYGKLVSPLRHIPIAEPWVTIITKIPDVADTLKEILGEQEDLSVSGQRRELQKRLEELEHPILVVIDDIDRLTPPEIRDIFKLVRLTANFANVIYVVAFDRKRVEAALSDTGLSGRDYLEKIIQLPIDIPSIPANALNLQIASELNDVLGDPANIENPEQFTTRRWDTAYNEVIRPLIRNVRDLRRLAAALPGTLQNLEGKVSLIDVFTLEAVRIFRPDVFASIIINQEGLSYTKEEFFVRDLKKAMREKQVGAFLESDGKESSIVGPVLEVLFPAAEVPDQDNDRSALPVQEWIRERRVAYGPILAYFLERVTGAALDAEWVAEKLPELLHDNSIFLDFTKTVQADTMTEALLSLPTYEDHIPNEAIVPAACHLINFASSNLSHQSRWAFESPLRTAFGIGYRLVGRLTTPEERSAAIRAILECVSALDDKMHFLQWVGPGDDAREHQLLEDDEFDQVAKSLREEIRKANPDIVARQHDLYPLLQWVKKSSSSDEPPTQFQITDDLGRALIKAAVTVDPMRPRFGREDTANKTVRLDFLEEQFGSTDALLDFARDRQTSHDDQALSEAIALVIAQASEGVVRDSSSSGSG
jgi:ABC-type branched-subunit amino acid transport system ATPase component